MHTSGRFYWLWCCLGVLLAGCGQAFTTSATRTPALPLLTFPRPTITPTAILRLIRTPLVIPAKVTPNAAPLLISPPTCYETPVGSVWCLGLMQNVRAGPITAVFVNVYLVSSDGLALAEKRVSVPRKLLQPGESAPYGALFDSMPDNAAGPVAYMVAESASANSGYSSKIGIDDLQSEAREGLFHVTARLINHDLKTLSDLSIVATAFDATGRVTGYRQVLTDAGTMLAPGAALPIALDVAPQGPGTTRFELSAEGHIR